MSVPASGTRACPRVHPLSVLPVLLLLAALPTGARAAAPATLSADTIFAHVEVHGVEHPIPCEGESIRVTISGTLPSDCYSIRKVELEPLICIVPCAPRIRLLVDDGSCLGRPCGIGPVFWTREIRYGPLPPGNYEQLADVYKVSCVDTFPTGPPTVTFGSPFTVLPDSLCGAPIPGDCLLSDWIDNDPSSPCNTRLDAQGHATAGMVIHTPVPLSALQGRLHLSNDSLRIVGLHPAGPASGMTLVWNPTADGASFVMFSATGAPIPPPDFGPAVQPVLTVDLAVREGRHAPRVDYLSAGALVGADSSGHEVLECPILRAVLSAAVICGEAPPCDANRDGRSTVGDLVTMLNCLHSACADSARLDCNGDGHFALDDVICCAYRLLATPLPPPAGGETAPGSRLDFGEAERTGAGWRVPLRLSGVHGLGAARLAVSFPAGAYRVTDVTRDASAPSWLLLSDQQGGTLSLALLQVAPMQSDLIGADQIVVWITLEPLQGPGAGGALEVASAELASLDGQALEVPLPGPLPIPAGLSISPARPNPFSSRAEFVLGIDRAGDVRVTIHDVSGRRVATLFDGPLPPGTRTLRWTGADDAGRAVKDGIYFVRAASAGAVTTRKLVLLRGR